MKMISAGTAAANQYTQYVHNCTRNAACEPPFRAPLPSISDLQLYVDFGASQPSSLEFTLIDICNTSTDQIFPSEFIVGQTPELNWYGVFRGFSGSVSNTAFVIHLEVDGGGSTFFSQMLSTEACGPLMKVKSCHAEEQTTTAFDVNGIYYGLPDGASAGSEITYLHTAWLRFGKVRELNNKATFKSNLYFNARTTVEKVHQIETEIVPKWYKDVLLGVYSRGMVQVDDGQIYLVSDLAMDPLNDDDLMWKPYAQVKETFRLFFGCDEFCNIPEVAASGSASEPAPSESAPSASEPEINYFLTAAVNFSIDNVFGQPGLPVLPPTGTNGAQSGHHTGVVGGIVVQISGTIVIACKLVVLVDNVLFACTNIHGSDDYGFVDLNVLESQEIRISVNVGTC